MPALADLATFLDTTLNIVGVPDYPQALNGVQLTSTQPIERVASAVDFSTRSALAAIEAGARLLIVHHGMFWAGAQPVTGYRYECLRALISNDVAVYSAHLPLDVHPDVGNNALLAKLFELTPSGGFGRFQSIDVGVSGFSDIPTRTLAERAGALAARHSGTLVVTPFAEDRVTRAWGICSGSGADSTTLREATAKGLDTLIVGEGPHHTAVEACELGLVVMYAGHYATETLGVQALGTLLEQRFGVTHTFIDIPSGL